MTGAQTLLARTALGCVAATATVWLPRFRHAYRLSDKAFRQIYLSAFLGIRLLLFAAVFLVLRIAPRGDLPGIYLQEVKSHLAGGVPYRDYASSYAPLFPYLYAPLYRVHPSPLIFILFGISAEIVTAAVFLRFMPRVLPERQARQAALLCLVNPISLQFVAIDGQNNVLVGLALALALLWVAENRAVASGAALGLSIASVKFLPLLFTPAFPLFLRKRAAAWVAGCSAVVVVVYGFFALVLHAPVLQAAQREGEIKSAGGLPFLVETIVGRDLGRFGWDALLLLALAGIAGAGWHVAGRIRSQSGAALAATTYLLPALLLAVMGLGKKTWPTYTEMVLFPLSMVVAASMRDARYEHRGQGALWLLGGFSLLSVTAHSVWASLLAQASAVQVHGSLLGGDGTVWAFLLMEMALFACYAALAWLCLTQVRRIVPAKG